MNELNEVYVAKILRTGTTFKAIEPLISFLGDGRANALLIGGGLALYADFRKAQPA
jgi:hypothetical protein